MHTAHPSDTDRPPTARTRSRQAMPLATAIATLALLAAGCASSAPASPGTGSPVSFTAAAFRYSRCMRSHGLPSFRDPMMTDHDGQQVAYLTATISPRPSPAVASAQNACRGILPTPSNATATQLAQPQHTREQQLLAFARCVRRHGVTGFPDPTTQGQLTLEMVEAAGVDLHASAVLSAAKACLATANGAISAADVERAPNGP